MPSIAPTASAIFSQLPLKLDHSLSVVHLIYVFKANRIGVTSVLTFLLVLHLRRILSKCFDIFKVVANVFLSTQVISMME